jgi:hypothetical protein
MLKTSRWLSADPILDSYLDGNPAGGVFNPVNMNLYHYGVNNPLKYVDPNGLANKKIDLLSMWNSASYGLLTNIEALVPERFDRLGIYAVNDGIIHDIQTQFRDDGSERSYGNTVWIKHPDGVITQYSHLHSYTVKVGDSVKGGEQIGIMGDTGTGAKQGQFHLHFGYFPPNANYRNYKEAENGMDYILTHHWPTNTNYNNEFHSTRSFQSGTPHEGIDFGHGSTSLIEGWQNGLFNLGVENE